MPSGYSNSPNAAKFSSFFCSKMPLLLLVLLLTCHDIVSARELILQDPEAPKHLNFLRSSRGRKSVLSCRNDPAVCLDREKNPWGGTTCCFQSFCRDTLRDSSHCGVCGRACVYGLVCCDGKCVDVQNDPHNCGSCFQECPGNNRCSFAMCDYGA